MQVEIITPDTVLFSGEAKLVQLPGTDGSFEILNQHAPIIATLGKGKIKVVNNSGETSLIEIVSGVVEMSDNKANILAEQPK
ncbi:MAG: F0F1 ATP synthase subunit epsilon [Flavobacteriales bacterium]|nr:F0F1 ATP synthase subunit epsilon [Flavobacteriales bacterium]